MVARERERKRKGKKPLGEMGGERARETGVRRGEGRGEEAGGGEGAARSAHCAKCSAAKAPALTLPGPLAPPDPGGPSVRRRKQGTGTVWPRNDTCARTYITRSPLFSPAFGNSPGK